MPSRDKTIVIGRITRPHSISGEVKVQMEEGFETVFDDALPRVYLNNSDKPLRVLSMRPHQGALLLRLEGVVTRNDSEAIRGALLSIDPVDLPKLDGDEYYAHDLIGFNVTRENGEVLGELTEVLATGSNDVYVIAREKGELLLPVIDSCIKAIDRDARVIKVVVPEGLD